MSTLKRLVWTAVLAVVLAVASVVLAVLGHDTVSFAVGLAAVTSAMLASREVK